MSELSAAPHGTSRFARTAPIERPFRDRGSTPSPTDADHRSPARGISIRRATKRYPPWMDLKATCVDLLAREAGTNAHRAGELVDALHAASAQEALEVMAGKADAGGTQLDSRVRRLATLLELLQPGQAPPTPYELGAMFKLTVAQAQSCLRSYKARYPNEYRNRMKPTISAVAKDGKKTSIDADGIASLEFDALEPLAYAAEELQRRGYTKALRVDKSGLRIFVANTAPGAVTSVPSAVQFLKDITA